jgi:ATP-dependent Lhr-like helicase
LLATSKEALMIANGIGRLWRNGFVEMIQPPPSPTHIFAQQVMALVLQEGGIADRDWRSWLDDVLAGVDQPTERHVVAHMVEQRILAEDGGILGLGPEGEAAFGRRHFQDLVAAFTTPLLLAVRYGNVDLGNVDPVSIEAQRTSVPVILLGGRSWRVLNVDWPRRVASVEPTAEQGRSRWLGSGRALHPEIAQAIEQVLVTGDSGVTLSRRADAALTELRQDMPFLDGEAVPVVASGDEVRIWTFAGGRANAILAASLSSRKLGVRTTDNFSVAIATSDGDDVIRALQTVELGSLRIPVPDRVMNELKFRACLPGDCARAVLAARLAAQDAIEKFLGRPRRIVRLSGR